MSQLPRIGVMPLFDDRHQSLWMLPQYLEAVRQSGGLPLILPLTTDKSLLREAVVGLDGLLFTGGHDLDPALFGKAPVPACERPCPQRDEMELLLLHLAFFENPMPVFGICRGFQMMAAALGGNICLDLPSLNPSEISHRMEKPYDRTVHTVSVKSDSLLALITGRSELCVNSLHHMAVEAPFGFGGVRICATAPDGVVEGIELPGHPFALGVQWHPEYLFPTDEASRRIFAAFVAACR